MYLKYLILLFFTAISLDANNININNANSISVMEKCEIFIDDKSLSIKEVINKNKFKPYTQNYLNIGATQKTVWIKFSLKNNQDRQITRLLITSNSILEHIILYPQDALAKPIYKGTRHFNKDHRTLYYAHKITLPPQTQKTYFLQIKSSMTGVRFGLSIEEEELYYKKDTKRQYVSGLILGAVASLMIFSFLMFIYTKDKSFFFYGFFLFTIVYWQISYLGLLQLYFPKYLVDFDTYLVAIKANMTVFASALFTISFLQINKVRYLHKIYKIFIFIALFNCIFFSTAWSYNLNITLVPSFLYVIYALISSIILYNKGIKQAKLYILGTGVVIVVYAMVILDASGIISVMYKFPDLMLYAIVFEAMVLSLAFVDRYKILQEEKELADYKLLQDSIKREKNIQHEVDKKTIQLQEALKTQEVLFQELNHRVKNNLQMILSINDLQKEEYKDQAIINIFQKWENRIIAIAKTHELMYMSHDIEMIDMQDYIESLVENLEDAYATTINFTYNINLELPLNKAIYIGLIINELISNSIKYAFTDKTGEIQIELNKDFLSISDNGQGYIPNDYNHGIGLKLVNILVKEQLNATLSVENNNGTLCIIRFQDEN